MPFRTQQTCIHAILENRSSNEGSTIQNYVSNEPVHFTNTAVTHHCNHCLYVHVQTKLCFFFSTDYLAIAYEIASFTLNRVFLIVHKQQEFNTWKKNRRVFVILNESYEIQEKSIQKKNKA